VETRHAG